MHNLSLDMVSKLPGFPSESNEAAYAAIKELVTSQLTALGNGPSEFINYEEAQNYVDGLLSNLDNAIEYIDGITPLPSAKRIFLQQMQTLIYANYTLTEDFSLFAGLLGGLREITEKRVDLPENQKAALLHATAVAQASGIYWQSAYRAKNNPWHSFAVAAQEHNNAAKILWADLGGFVLGCAICSETGPACIACGVALGGFSSKVFGQGQS